MIKMIRVDKIFPHPDNPRKDLYEHDRITLINPEDLKELADSIRENGILQNLTVVPWGSNVPEWGEEEQRYTVIIGHRRLAAAKLAGLERVPCVISNMDKKTQIATMLLENMQRSDLTIYEQAQGFQMMLDLGETVSNISEKTGFSESTVRRRTKLLKLDQKKLKETMERGATLSDYAKLEEIEDLELRNKVLEHIGTENFRWELSKAKDMDRRNKIIAQLVKQLDRFATQVEERTDDFVYVRTYNDTVVNEEVIRPEDADDREYFYQVHEYGQIVLYAERRIEDAEELKEMEKRQAIEAKRDARINEIEERGSQLRKEFIYSLPNSKVKPFIGDIILLAIETKTYLYLWPSRCIEIFKLTIDEEDFEIEEVYSDILQQPELSFLKIIYDNNFKNSSYFDFHGKYKENKALDMFYNLLGKLGYQMSEEEKALQNGTHELFGGV